MSANKVSIAIVTKDRGFELTRCLLSIARQTALPFEVIILDNSAHGLAREVLSHTEFKSLKTRYIKCSKNVPGCRNLALSKARTKYLAFVDDDCVLTEGWLENGLTEISQTKKAYVLGNTHLLNPDNYFACAQYARDNYWRLNRLESHPEDPREIFDTKNVILDLEQIKNAKIVFSQDCQYHRYDIADFELGLSLYRASLSGSFCCQMKLYHQETDNFTGFVNRAYARGKLLAIVRNKWRIKQDFVNKKDRHFVLWMLRLIKHFQEDFMRYSSYVEVGVVKKIGVVFLIKVFERFYTLGYVSRN